MKKEVLNIAKSKFNKLNDLMKKLKFAKELTSEEVSISEKEVGGKVEIKNESGELVAIEDGEYIVDEFHFIVKDGLIAEVLEKMEEVIIEDEAIEEVKTDVAEMKDEIGTLIETVEVLVDVISDVQLEFKKIKSAFAKIPAGKKEEFDKENNEKKNKIAELFNKNKK